MRCPVDSYQYISQTYADHVARALANGWAPYPTGVPGTVYYYGGIDYAVYNAPCKAAADGTVSLVETNNVGYGKCVRIDHGGGLISIYAHLSSINVASGQSVKEGDIIGVTGNTGHSTGPHLHFELRLNGSPVDPQPYLDGTNSTMEPMEEEEKMKGTVLVDRLAIRRLPFVASTCIKRVDAGTELDVDDVEAIWARLKDGTYVAVKYNGEYLVKLEE